MGRKARVFFDGHAAGVLEEDDAGQACVFRYDDGYDGPAISLTMPTAKRTHNFDGFPPFFEGLLPEGFQLQHLLQRAKIDRKDAFAQLLAVGGDMVGAVTVEALA